MHRIGAKSVRDLWLENKKGASEFWDGIREVLNRTATNLKNFKEKIKERETKIDKIEAEINNGKFPWKNRIIEDVELVTDKLILWALLMRFACGFHEPILSKEDVNLLKTVGMFLKYRYFIYFDLLIFYLFY